MSKVLEQYLNDKLFDENFNLVNQKEPKSPLELGTVSNVSKWSCSIIPVLSYDSDDNLSKDKTISRKTGFTITPDPHGDMTISVYRSRTDQVWKSATDNIRDNVDIMNDEDLLYGSYVFFTEEGTTYCPHEAEERTLFYNKGTLLNNDTRYATKPEMTADTYEQVNVPADKAASENEKQAGLPLILHFGDVNVEI